MKKIQIFIFLILEIKGYAMDEIKLPKPIFKGNISVEEAIKKRRTVRSFKNDALTLQQVSQVLWASNGITEDAGYKRAIPSAGALYPLNIYMACGKNSIKDVEEGIYLYDVESHSIRLIKKGDLRVELSKASLNQRWMSEAPVMIIITVEYERTTGKYGSRGEKYAVMEAGNSSQNVFLQAGALGLDCGIVGAFDDDSVSKICLLPKRHRPLLIMPIGYKRE